MIINYVFEESDIVEICGDDNEMVQVMDSKTCDYIIYMINNLIQQVQAERSQQWNQLYNLMYEVEGMRTAFAIMANEAQYGVVQEVQPVIIESLKQQGIL